MTVAVECAIARAKGQCHSATQLVHFTDFHTACVECSVRKGRFRGSATPHITQMRRAAVSYLNMQGGGPKCCVPKSIYKTRQYCITLMSVTIPEYTRDGNVETDSTRKRFVM